MIGYAVRAGEQFRRAEASLRAGATMGSPFALRPDCVRDDHHRLRPRHVTGTAADIGPRRLRVSNGCLTFQRERSEAQSTYVLARSLLLAELLARSPVKRF